MAGKPSPSSFVVSTDAPQILLQMDFLQLLNGTNLDDYDNRWGPLQGHEISGLDVPIMLPDGFGVSTGSRKANVRLVASATADSVLDSVIKQVARYTREKPVNVSPRSPREL